MKKREIDAVGPDIEDENGDLVIDRGYDEPLYGEGDDLKKPGRKKPGGKRRARVKGKG